MADTPDFIEPGDVNDGYSLLPPYVTRTTLRGMISDDIEPGEWALAEFVARMDTAQPTPATDVQPVPE